MSSSKVETQEGDGNSDTIEQIPDNVDDQQEGEKISAEVVTTVALSGGGGESRSSKKGRRRRHSHHGTQNAVSSVVVGGGGSHTCEELEPIGGRTISPPSSEYKVIMNSAGLGAKRRPRSPNAFRRIFPNFTSNSTNDPGPSNRYSTISAPGPSGLAPGGGGGDDLSADALSLFDLMPVPSDGRNSTSEDQGSSELELEQLRNKMRLSENIRSSLFTNVGPSSNGGGDGDQDSAGAIIDELPNSSSIGASGSNFDYLLSLLPPATPTTIGPEIGNPPDIPCEEPIIIRGNGNMTLFGLSNSFATTFPSSLLGRVSREEFDYTITRINNLLRQQHSTNAKFLLLGCLCCCCSFGCSLLWPTLALSKRTRNSLQKVRCLFVVSCSMLTFAPLRCWRWRTHVSTTN